MFEQFDQQIMKRALKRSYPVEDDLPQGFRDLLRRLDAAGDPEDACAAAPRERLRQSCG